MPRPVAAAPRSRCRPAATRGSCSPALGAVRRALRSLLVMASLGASVGLQPVHARRRRPRGSRAREIPPVYLRLYQAGRPALRHGPVDPRRHRLRRDRPRPVRRAGRALGRATRSAAARGRCSSRSIGSPSTWERFGVDGNDDGRMSVYDPADAIPAAARYLKASGAPGGLPRARCSRTTTPSGTSPQVLAKADEYRGATTGELPAAPDGVPPADRRACAQILAEPADHADADPAHRRALRRARPAPARHAGVDRASTTRS